jgi:hypothetical protein
MAARIQERLHCDGKLGVIRMVPRRAVTHDPAIEWFDAAGRTRRTPIRVFNTAPRSFAAVNAYNGGMVARIEKLPIFDGKGGNRRRPVDDRDEGQG